MKKPNLALRLMARAVAAKRKALKASNKRVALAYARQANRYLSSAAAAPDSVNAIRIIKASNQHAAIVASRIRAEADEDEVVVVDDEDVDPIYSEDEFYGDEGVCVSAEDEDDAKEDKDEGATEDEPEEKDEDTEVDSAMLRVLSRNRRRRLAALKAKRARRL